MQLFSNAKNAEIHVFPRFRRFYITYYLCKN
uniref:S-adenosylmethionine decarboxylase n=1 Tax=Myoviridae sp. ctro722 TaxID=2827615 RepID=A0A8S5LM39_9CAUD|nr:MAG TPA: S-adenosylmethionine decarboxylase [Myoviridae sp. ctro722]